MRKSTAVLTAAQMARTNAALDKRIDVNGEVVSFRELIDAGSIAYIRERPFRNGNVSRGIILHTDAIDTHGTDHDTLAEALSYVSYFDAPKLVTDYLYNEGVSRVVIRPDSYVIESAAL